MKTTLVTFVTLAFLSTSSAFAQCIPNSDRYEGSANSPYDDIQEDMWIEKLDDIVNLSHRQERVMKRIEDRYDRRGLTREERHNPQAYRRLQWQKRQDMLAVLTPFQHQRLMEYQRANRYGFNRGRRDY